MKNKTESFIVTTENGREQIQVSSRAEADTAKADLERRHGRTVLILPIRKPLVGGAL